jgi:hypothetical protein
MWASVAFAAVDDLKHFLKTLAYLDEIEIIGESNVIRD